jgi:hypothetical protein
MERDHDADLESIIERLRELPHEARTSEDGWPAVRERIEPRGLRAVTAGPSWLRAAAAVVLFAAGGLGGFFIARADGDAGMSASRFDEALALAAEVQRTGTEYVAALAAFAAVVDSMSADVRVQGRDAAIATLFGAANELAVIGGPPDGVIVPVSAGDRRSTRF